MSRLFTPATAAVAGGCFDGSKNNLRRQDSTGDGRGAAAGITCCPVRRCSLLLLPLLPLESDVTTGLVMPPLLFGAVAVVDNGMAPADRVVRTGTGSIDVLFAVNDVDTNAVALAVCTEVDSSLPPPDFVDGERPEDSGAAVAASDAGMAGMEVNGTKCCDPLLRLLLLMSSLSLDGRVARFSESVGIEAVAAGIGVGKKHVDTPVDSAYNVTKRTIIQPEAAQEEPIQMIQDDVTPANHSSRRSNINNQQQIQLPPPTAAAVANEQDRQLTQDPTVWKHEVDE